MPRMETKAKIKWGGGVHKNSKVGIHGLQLTEQDELEAKPCKEKQESDYRVMLIN